MHVIKIMDDKLLKQKLEKIPSDKFDDIIESIANKRKAYIHGHLKYELDEYHRLDGIDEILKTGKDFFEKERKKLHERHDMNKNTLLGLTKEIEVTTKDI